MPLSSRKEVEFERDIKVLKKILYEIIERSIIFQQKVKEQMPSGRDARRTLLKTMARFTNVKDFVFFDPRDFIGKCLDQDRNIDLKKIRQVRAVFTQLTINVDKVTISLLNQPSLTISQEVGILVHLFDGLEERAKRQIHGLKQLQKLLKDAPETTPVSMIIDSIAKARVLCTFYIKWLTVADNEYTDRRIGEADVNAKREFSSEMTRNLVAITRAELFALGDNLSSKIDMITRMMEEHSKESQVNQDAIRGEFEFLRELCSQIAESHTDEIKEFMGSKTSQILSLLTNVERELRDKGPNTAVRARTLKSRVEKGLGTAADVVQLLTFLVGIPSLPAMLGSTTAVRVFQFLKDLANSVKR